MFIKLLLSAMSKLVLLFVLSNLLILTNGYPIEDNGIGDTCLYDQYMSDPPKWYDHCKNLPYKSINSILSAELHNTSPIKEMFYRVKKSVSTANKRAEDLKKKFNDFEHIFNDFEDLRFKPNFQWLPKIPLVSVEDFQDMTREIAILKAHQYVERFAVAIEQILIDQELYSGYNGIDKQEFKNIAEDNYSVLCEIRIAMSLVFGSTNEHFISNTRRDVMPHETRCITEFSKRSLRDYLILRQYVTTTQYLTELIGYHSQKVQQNIDRK